MQLDKTNLGNGDYRTCPACHGYGTQYSTVSGLKEECPMCGGEGKILTKEAKERKRTKPLFTC